MSSWATALLVAVAGIPSTLAATRLHSPLHHLLAITFAVVAALGMVPILLVTIAREQIAKGSLIRTDKGWQFVVEKQNVEPREELQIAVGDWSLSEERVFVENLLHTRLNILLVIATITLTGTAISQDFAF
jgi:hypothetical protein